MSSDSDYDPSYSYGSDAEDNEINEQEEYSGDYEQAPSSDDGRDEGDEGEGEIDDGDDEGAADDGEEYNGVNDGEGENDEGDNDDGDNDDEDSEDGEKENGDNDDGENDDGENDDGGDNYAEEIDEYAERSSTDSQAPSSNEGSDSEEIEDNEGSEESDGNESSEDKDDNEGSEDNDDSEDSETDETTKDLEVSEDNEGDEPRVGPVRASEVPDLLNALESSDLHDFIITITKLTYIVNHQTDLFYQFILPNVNHFFNLVQEKREDEERRPPLVNLITQIATTSKQGSLAVRAHLEVFVFFLLYPVDCFSVLTALEKMLQEDRSFETFLVTILRRHVLTFPGEVVARDWGQHRTVIECFRYTIIYREEKLRTAFAKAGAIEFVINTIGAPDAATREVAIHGLGEVLTAKDDLRAHFALRNPYGGYEDPMYFHGMLSTTVIGVLRDRDDRVVNAALTFLWSDDSDAASVFICSSDDALFSLALCLARKDPEVLGASVDWLLSRYAEADIEAVTGAFWKVWASEYVSIGTKIGVLRGVANSFDKVKLAAGRGGMAELVLQILHYVEHRFALLSFLPKLLEDDCFIGHVILKNGAVNLLLNVFENGKSIEERCLAATVLSLLPQASRPDEYNMHTFVPLRTAASFALAQGSVLSRILPALHSPETKISAAALNLLAEILKTDDQFDIDAPAPIKDRVVNPDLAILVVTKLKVPQLAPPALNVLTEMCWAYKRGFGIVQKAFRAFIPQADSVFFAALDGEDASEFVSRRRYRVADAAVLAGAIPRMLALLEKPITSVNSCCITVQAFRTLLRADSADREAGRRSSRISVLLARLIADGSIDSLLQVALIVRLLSDAHNYHALETWSGALAKHTIVNQLITTLNTNIVVFEPPSKDLPVEMH